MTLSTAAKSDLARRVLAFLEEARRDVGTGAIEPALRRYCLPFVLVDDQQTEILATLDDLRCHLRRLGELIDATALPIWRQEIVDIQLIDHSLIVVTTEVLRVDSHAHPVPPQRQSIVLRREDNSFRFVSVVNPIRRDHWTQDTPAVRGS